MPKIILVTGGTMGIGAALVDELRKDNHTVITCARTPTNDSIRCDVSDANDVKEMFREIYAKYGRLDVLINNAAIYSRGPVATMDPVEWRNIIDINLNGVFNCCHYAIPIMIKNNYGRIVNLVSYTMYYLPPERSAYSASKIAVAALTTTLSKEILGYNIKVNCICPGSCRTRMDLDNKSIREPQMAVNDIIDLTRLPDDGPSGLTFKDGKVWQIFS
jgi:3-oxoacyl-[acyl-carrier protein] reductase